MARQWLRQVMCMVGPFNLLLRGDDEDELNEILVIIYEDNVFDSSGSFSLNFPFLSNMRNTLSCQNMNREYNAEDYDYIVTVDTKL